MGVIPCDRADCHNVNCQYYTYERSGHVELCSSCYEELVQLGPGTDLKKFLARETGLAVNLEASRAYFEKIFVNRNKDSSDDED